MQQQVREWLQLRAATDAKQNPLQAYRIWYFEKAIPGTDEDAIVLAHGPAEGVLKLDAYTRKNAKDYSQHPSKPYSLIGTTLEYLMENEDLEDASVAEIGDHLLGHLFDEDNDTLHVRELEIVAS